MERELLVVGLGGVRRISVRHMDLMGCPFVVEQLVVSWFVLHRLAPLGLGPDVTRPA
jgi:hypothetical protein